MHDSMGHRLTALIMQIEMGKEYLKKEPEKPINAWTGVPITPGGSDRHPQGAQGPRRHGGSETGSVTARTGSAGGKADSGMDGSPGCGTGVVTKLERAIVRAGQAMV